MEKDGFNTQPIVHGDHLVLLGLHHIHIYNKGTNEIRVRKNKGTLVRANESELHALFYKQSVQLVFVGVHQCFLPGTYLDWPRIHY